MSKCQSSNKNRIQNIWSFLIHVLPGLFVFTIEEWLCILNPGTEDEIALKIGEKSNLAKDKQIP